MKMLLYFIFLWTLISCANQNPPVESNNTKQKTVDDDCPPGVKIGCNVPKKTQEEMDAKIQDYKTCVNECIKSRQAESIAHDVIETQCQDGCNQHLIEQVQVIQSKEEMEAPTPEQ